MVTDVQRFATPSPLRTRAFGGACRLSPSRLRCSTIAEPPGRLNRSRNAEPAVAAGIHDMYGPRGRNNEAVLDAAIVGRFGYDQQTCTLPAGLHIVTSTCFSASGADGHFAWVTGLLNPAVVRRSLDV
jgi:hypothetical protein